MNYWNIYYHTMTINILEMKMAVSILLLMSQRLPKWIKDKYDIELNNTFQIFGNNNAYISHFEYFCAKDLFDGKIKKTHNTYTIHHFSGSWLNEWGKIKQSAKIYLSKFLGRSFVEMIAKIKNIIK